MSNIAEAKWLRGRPAKTAYKRRRNGLPEM